MMLAIIQATPLIVMFAMACVALYRLAEDVADDDRRFELAGRVAFVPEVEDVADDVTLVEAEMLERLNARGRA